MSAKKSKRAPRPAPGKARSWYAMPPAKGWGGCVLMRRDAAGRSRKWACCDSHARATKLAAALNRAEEDAQTVLVLSERAIRLHAALRHLVDMARFVRPALRDGGAFEAAIENARRVLGDEPTFAPGGEEVAR